jgi:flavin-binding protein dodecin
MRSERKKKGENILAERIAKITELIGQSDEGWQKAAEIAVEEASKTIRGITGVQVLKLTGKVTGGKIVEYRANVRIAFGVEGHEE